MPDSHITDHQVKLYMQFRERITPGTAAKSGFSTATTYPVGADPRLLGALTKVGGLRRPDPQASPDLKSLAPIDRRIGRGETHPLAPARARSPPRAAPTGSSATRSVASPSTRGEPRFSRRTKASPSKTPCSAIPSSRPRCSTGSPTTPAPPKRRGGLSSIPRSNNVPVLAMPRNGEFHFGSNGEDHPGSDKRAPGVLVGLMPMEGVANEAVRVGPNGTDGLRPPGVSGPTRMCSENKPSRPHCETIGGEKCEQFFGRTAPACPGTAR